MTDLEKFIELYKGFGIECKVIDEEKESRKVILLGESDYPAGDKMTTSEKIKGYSCFFSDVVFDSNGKFIEQGFYE